MGDETKAIWYNDGHTISVRLEGGRVYISEVGCPEGSEDCINDRVGCVVKYFVNRFGFDCNVGSCDVEPVMEIAWNLAGDQHDIEAAQVWIIPAKDDAFAAWVSSQQK